MTDMDMVHHWHVAHGLAGYGPEGSDGYAYFTDPESLADYVRGELDSDAEALHDSATAYAEAGDFEEAWKTHMLTEEMATVAANFDNKRRDAPIYRDDRAAWHMTILHLVVEHFPYVTSPPAGQLYVWQCQTGYECEHYRPTDEERIERVIEYLTSSSVTNVTDWAAALLRILTERTED